MAQGRRLSAAEVRVAVLDCAVLALASVLSYWLVGAVARPPSGKPHHPAA